ncbi:MAG: hypothetical protein BGO67_10490 [Alphaproteobacteria bacterium 41-28]|nr:MAG: hypothetical protein BGO67_10490 [Alphaproteobacteria bacterium 41-28]
MMRYPLIFLFSCAAVADPWKNLKQGDQVAQEFLNKVDEKKAKAGSHPFYKGHSKESNLKSTDLLGKSQSLAQQDPASQMIYESSNARPQVKIDPEKDPLIVRADKIGETPLTAIGGEGTQLVEVQQGGTHEIIDCEESGEDSLETCASQLKVKVVKTTVQKEWKGQFHLWKDYDAGKYGLYLACGALRHEILTSKRRGSGNITASYKACLQEIGNKERKRSKLNKQFITRGAVRIPRLNLTPSQIKEVTIDQRPPIRTRKGNFRNPGYYIHCEWDEHKHGFGYRCHPAIMIVYEEESYEVLPDEWVSHCNRLEKRVDQGLCYYATKSCTQGRQTRDIEGIPITRDCWQETFTYRCAYPAKNDCGPLRAQGCAQINSNCKQKIGNACVVYNQTYECKEPPHTSHKITGGQTPFCLDGNCRDQGWDKNNEMMSSLAQLAILKELQGQFGKGGFFKGETNKCSKQPLSFKDCCGSGKGWGNDLGLSSCSSKEKLLSQRRKKGLCHYIGTYCSKKVLGQCIKKKSTYCCWGSKLLKVFHEQGRLQIGMGWGTPKEPLCRGFSIEEIQRIDFSKLDLREVFEDLMKNFKPGKMQNIGKKVNDRLEIIKKGLIPKAPQQPKQREGA